MATPVLIPQRRKTDSLGNVLGVAQGVGGLVAAFGGPVAPIGAAVAGGATLANIVRKKPEQGSMQLPQTSDTSIRDRLANDRQSSLIALREANEAINQLPEDQRQRYQRPIGLALQQV